MLVAIVGTVARLASAAPPPEDFYVDVRDYLPENFVTDGSIDDKAHIQKCFAENSNVCFPGSDDPARPMIYGVTAEIVGRIFRLIEDTGLLENTIVVFMSDHGMYLGERGRTGKSLITADQKDCIPFHCELANICWSMHVPPLLGTKPRPGGTRLEQVVQAPDLMPTILDMCGVAVPSGAKLEGLSLLPLLTGQSDDPPRDLSITASTIMTHHENKKLKCRMPTITDGEWTMLINEPPDPNPPRLFHVADDPRQQHDVFAEHHDEARRLHARMIQWLRQHETGGEAVERLSAVNAGLV